MRILNLYACLGGNRYKWGDEHEITAVELDPELGRMYQERFPKDKVIVADAHQYLLDHFREFDFIWTSPPCPSHSRAAFGSRKSIKASHKPLYPDMKLYQEIIFLKHYFDGKYVVENVIPYYDPLIPAKKRGRHLYWTNFNLPSVLSTRKSISMEDVNEVGQWCVFHDYNFRNYKGKQTIQKIARNLVDYEAGKTILDTVLGIEQNLNAEQIKLF
jgi:DNA (cytosine-5)-methyltransferase 1|tara:strand:- start:1793 stop:2437 length:645 start_codon:yes stop_codon:yes gene_type:complete